MPEALPLLLEEGVAAEALAPAFLPEAAIASSLASPLAGMTGAEIAAGVGSGALAGADMAGADIGGGSLAGAGDVKAGLDINQLSNIEPSNIASSTGTTPTATASEASLPGNAPVADTGLPIEEGKDLLPDVQAGSAMDKPYELTQQQTPNLPSAQTMPGSNAPVSSDNAFTKALQSLGITDGQGGLGKNAFQAASLGGNLMSQANASKTQKTLQEQLQKQADVTGPTANKLIGQYNQGQVGAQADKQVNDFIAQQKAQIKQRYARMGRDPEYDSAAQQEMANVDIQAASMRDSALQNVLSSGLKAAGVTAGPAQQAILAGYNADQNAQKQQQDFLKTLAEMQRTAGTGTTTSPSMPQPAY